MLLVSSLGLAVISMIIFGLLLGHNGSFKLVLGVVNEDQSPVSAQVVAQLKKSNSLTVYTGSQSSEVQALRDGNRNAVIVLTPGFGANLAQGHAAIQVYYDQSNPATQASAQMAVQSIVTEINQQATGRAPVVSLDQRAVSVHNLRQIDWLTPGMLGLVLLWGNLSVGEMLVAWRQQGIMKRLAVTPVRPTTLISSQMLARLLLSLAQCALLLALAIFAFRVQVVGSWLALLVTVILGALMMMALGFIAGSFAKTPETAATITILVSFPMMFLGGSYFPTNNAPAFLAPVIKAMPLTYVNDALRQIINNGVGLAGVQTDLLIIAAWMVAALIISVRAFRWA
jgi:ABC-2 type transport system permease protein